MAKNHTTYSWLTGRYQVMYICFCSVGSMVRSVSVSQHPCLFDARHMLCENHINQTSASHKLMHGTSEVGCMRPKDPFPNDNMQWSPHAHVSCQTVNEKATNT